jgi:hypothetical protein
MQSFQSLSFNHTQGRSVQRRFAVFDLRAVNCFVVLVHYEVGEVQQIVNVHSLNAIGINFFGLL